MKPKFKELNDTTEKCFADFATKHPDLSSLQLVADFCCQGNLEEVQRWQRGEYMPGGEKLLRLRCFLYLANYGVAEFSRMQGILQQLAVLIAFGDLDATKVSGRLGFKSQKAPVHSLWRILIHGNGTSEEVLGKIETIVNSERQQRPLKRHTKEWLQRITTVLGPSQPEEPEPELAPAIDVAALAVVLGRDVSSLTTLVKVMVDANAKDAALAETHGGKDVHELISALQSLVS